MKKILASLLAVVLLLSSFSAVLADSTLALTVEELAAYNGQNGARAYVAVNGKIYDVTDVEAWDGGSHKGVVAGIDATEAIAGAPHGEKVLEKLTEVGILVDSELTFAELAAFNGKDGANAYVAVNGLVYDVSGSSAWGSGVHNGVEAGTDASEAIAKAPHGVAILEKLTVVAKIKDFTVEELAAFNGQNGNAAYVTVDGLVYDVSNLPAWANGTHNGALAGTDISENIKQAPHGLAKLEGLTIIGYLR